MRKAADTPKLNDSRILQFVRGPSYSNLEVFMNCVVTRVTITGTRVTSLPIEEMLFSVRSTVTGEG